MAKLIVESEDGRRLATFTIRGQVGNITNTLQANFPDMVRALNDALVADAQADVDS
jgi:hypothetical protein